MLRSHLAVGIVAMIGSLAGAAAACAQDYPTKPIRVVTSLAGGGNDFTARLIAQGITGPLGQPVVVDNRPTLMTPEIVSKAPPDGYTLLVASSPFFIGPFFQKVSYDPVKDFSPVTWISKEPSVLVVHPSVAASSVKDLVALAKANPGKLNYSSGIRGSSYQLAGELFKAMAGVNIVSVPYSGGGPSILAALAGEVQMTFGSSATVAPHVKSGKLRGLAVTSAQTSPLAPDLPTMAASGLPGYEYVGIDLVFAPARTPAPVIARLNREMAHFINTPATRDRLLAAGSEAVGSSPEELAAKMKSDMVRLGKVIRDIGITVD